MKLLEDMDPIETVINWLKYIVKMDGKMSPHDFDYVLNTVVPQAEKQYAEFIQLQEEVKF